MPIRVVVSLSPEEAEGLNHLAAENLRDRRDQLRWVLRQHLEERGMLPSDPPEPAVKQPREAARK